MLCHGMPSFGQDQIHPHRVYMISSCCCSVVVVAWLILHCPSLESSSGACWAGAKGWASSIYAPTYLDLGIVEMRDMERLA
jgi:hypothetical protein